MKKILNYKNKKKSIILFIFYLKFKFLLFCFIKFLIVTKYINLLFRQLLFTFKNNKPYEILILIKNKF